MCSQCETLTCEAFLYPDDQPSCLKKVFKPPTDISDSLLTESVLKPSLSLSVSMKYSGLGAVNTIPCPPSELFLAHRKRCFFYLISAGVARSCSLSHVFVLRSVPRDLHLAGCQLVVDVVNAEGDHDNQPQDQPQDQGQGFFQLLPLVHRALVFCRGRKSGKRDGAEALPSGAAAAGAPRSRLRAGRSSRSRRQSPGEKINCFGAKWSQSQRRDAGRGYIYQTCPRTGKTLSMPISSALSATHQ